MASETTKLQLVKPTDLESADVGDFNDNMDKIDAAMPIIVYSNTQPENPVEGMIWLKPIGG